MILKGVNLEKKNINQLIQFFTFINVYQEADIHKKVNEFSQCLTLTLGKNKFICHLVSYSTPDTHFWYTQTFITDAKELGTVVMV